MKVLVSLLSLWMLTFPAWANRSVCDLYSPEVRKQVRQCQENPQPVKQPEPLSGKFELRIIGDIPTSGKYTISSDWTLEKILQHVKAPLNAKSFILRKHPWKILRIDISHAKTDPPPFIANDVLVISDPEIKKRKPPSFTESSITFLKGDFYPQYWHPSHVQSNGFPLARE